MLIFANVTLILITSFFATWSFIQARRYRTYDDLLLGTLLVSVAVVLIFNTASIW